MSVIGKPNIKQLAKVDCVQSYHPQMSKSPVSGKDALAFTVLVALVAILSSIAALLSSSRPTVSIASLFSHGKEGSDDACDAALRQSFHTVTFRLDIHWVAPLRRSASNWEGVGIGYTDQA